MFYLEFKIRIQVCSETKDIMYCKVHDICCTCKQNEMRSGCQEDALSGWHYPVGIIFKKELCLGYIPAGLVCVTIETEKTER